MAAERHPLDVLTSLTFYECVFLSAPSIMGHTYTLSLYLFHAPDTHFSIDILFFAFVPVPSRFFGNSFFFGSQVSNRILSNRERKKHKETLWFGKTAHLRSRLHESGSRANPAFCCLLECIFLAGESTERLLVFVFSLWPVRQALPGRKQKLGSRSRWMEGQSGNVRHLREFVFLR